MKTGIVMPFLKILTIRATENMLKELGHLKKNYNEGNLLISYSRYSKLRHAIMNKFSISKIDMFYQLIKMEVKNGNTTWVEQLDYFDPTGKFRSTS